MGSIHRFKELSSYQEDESLNLWIHCIVAKWIHTRICDGDCDCNAIDNGSEPIRVFYNDTELHILSPDLHHTSFYRFIEKNYLLKL